MKKIPLFPLLAFSTALLPLILLLWISLSILNHHIKSTVANDPQTSLSQSLSGLSGAHNRWVNGFYFRAVKFSGKDSLKKALVKYPSSSQSVTTLCGEFLDAAKAPFFALTDKKGDVLFNNLNLPVPTPSPLPTPQAKKRKPGKPAILLPSLKDWPGMQRALAGSVDGGILPYHGALYQVSLVPIISNDKTLGVILVGGKLDKEYFQGLKIDAVNDLAFYSQSQTWCTGALPAPPFDYSKISDLVGHPEKRPTLSWNKQDYLVDGLPLWDIDLKPIGAIVLFQPIKQVLSIEGKPQRSILGWGLFLLLLSLAGTLGFCWYYLLPIPRMVTAVEAVQKGNLNTNFPTDPVSEWGRMGNSLQRMVEALREKEKISLILGKVVDPLAARKILSEKDYFVLKGEKRECTLLQADLKGFNTISENMAPQVLVDALNQYFNIINEAVFRHEGMLDKFIGETAIAVWGAPFTHEDKEWRAVQCALEVQEALKAFNISRIQQNHPPFTIGIGIHTAQMISGNLGSDKRMDYSVIGDGLHVTSRLCAMSAPGQIVITEETYRKVKEKVKASSLKPIAVKGSMDSLATFEITPLV